MLTVYNFLRLNLLYQAHVLEHIVISYIRISPRVANKSYAANKENSRNYPRALIEITLT